MPVVRTPRRRFNFGPALIVLPILLAAVAGIGGLAIGLCSVIAPGEGPLGGLLNDISGVETADLPGDARNFDAFGELAAVQAYAGEGTQLVEIELALVRADGTMDLKAEYTPKPDATYTFVREVERPSDAPPPGAGGANVGPWYETISVRAYEPGQRRRRTTIGGSTSSVVNYTNKGMEKETSDPASGEVETVLPPACGIEEFFDIAIAQGAPADSVARVTYDADGYTFLISGVTGFLEFDQNCQPVE